MYIIIYVNTNYILCYVSLEFPKTTSLIQDWCVKKHQANAESAVTLANVKHTQTLINDTLWCNLHVILLTNSFIKYGHILPACVHETMLLEIYCTSWAVSTIKSQNMH